MLNLILTAGSYENAPKTAPGSTKRNEEEKKVRTLQKSPSFLLFVP